MKTMLRIMLLVSTLVLALPAVASSQRSAWLSPGATRAPGAPAAAVDRPSPAFWTIVGDTTLARLIGEALERNHDVRVAGARVNGARAARLGAALDLTPAITTRAGYTRQRIASSVLPGAVGSLPDQDLWDAGLLLAWEVDVFGRGRRTLQGQGEMVAASSENLHDVQVVLAAELAAAYFELSGAQDRLAVARRNADNQRGTLDITMQRLEGGRGTALDTERARAQLSATLADIPALEATIDAARQRLGVLAARDPGSLDPDLGTPAVLAELPESPSVAIAEPFLRRRPDVRSAERQVAAQAAFVSAARTEYLPRVAFAGAAGYTGSTFESLGNGGTPRYAFGPVISWPGLDLGRVKAGVDVARAAEAEAHARYDQTLLRARAEIQTALSAYRRARERLDHLDEAAAASERAAELARLRYTEGASDFLQVLDAERTLLEAQDRSALGRTSAMVAMVAVYRAFGGVWPSSSAAPR